MWGSAECPPSDRSFMESVILSEAKDLLSPVADALRFWDQFVAHA